MPQLSLTKLEVFLMSSSKSSSPSSIDRLIIRLASERNGLVPTALLRAERVSFRAIARRVATGQLVEVVPGVRALGNVEIDSLQRAVAACLTNDSAHVSHTSALAFYKATLKTDHGAHVSNEKLIRLPNVVAHRITSPANRDVIRRYEVNISRPWLALVESASLLDEDELAVAMDSLVQSKDTSLKRISKCADEIGWFNGRKALVRLLEDRINGAGLVRSFLEQDLDKVLRKARLPVGVRNHRIVLPNGQRRELDRAWPHLRVGLEAHSWKYHSNTFAWGKTMTRDRGLTSFGWKILPVVVEDTRNPTSLVRDIRLSLAGV
jgi:hypothetical protein